MSPILTLLKQKTRENVKIVKAFQQKMKNIAAKGQPLCRIRLLSTALFPSLGRNLPAKTQVALAVDEHDGKRDKQQHARHDDGVQAHALNTPVAQHGAKHKGKDHAKVQQAVFQKAALVGDDVVVHVLQGITEVADTHGRGDAVTVDLAEALDLHAAGKRGEAVGEPPGIKLTPSKITASKNTVTWRQ